MARGTRGIKRPHPLGSLPTRSGVSLLTAESGIETSGLPGVKISGLPAAGAATETDQLEVNQGGISRRLTLDQALALVDVPAGDWDSITGKPSTFPPTVPIAQADVTSLVADLALKAPLASPVFTGDARAVTPPLGDVDTSIATTEWVTGEISAIPPSAATVTGFWNYNAAALVPPPANGRVRISVAWPPTIGASIHFYIAATDVDGFAYTWSLGPNVGDLFVFKSASGGRLTGTVTARTVAAYLDVTVLVSTVSGNNVNNSRCQISSVAAGGGGGGAPSGPAGGDLAGTYPNPTVNPEAIDDRVAALLVAGANVTLSYNDAAGSLTIASTAAGGGGGTVTSTSVATANGLAGTVATPTTTPAITLSTTVTGVLKGNGTAISAATAGTDYMTPGNVSAAYQPLDTGLTALSSIGTGIVTNTAADTFTGRTVTGTASRISVTNGNGVSGNPTLDIAAAYDALWQPVDADLTALAGLSATAGLVEQTGAAAFTKRALGVAASTSVPTRADADTRYLPAVSTTAPGSPIDNQLWFYSDDAIGGGQLFIRYNDGAGAAQWVPASPGVGSGAVVQTVSFQTGAVATGTTLIPVDNTIPQITEGKEYMTLAITPKSATSTLIITVNAMLTGDGTSTAVTCALFRDAVANALAATYYLQTTAGFGGSLTLVHTMTSGTTSTITFRVRGGQDVTGTVTFNGQGGVRFFGGVAASSIVIQEVL